MGGGRISAFIEEAAECHRERDIGALLVLLDSIVSTLFPDFTPYLIPSQPSAPSPPPSCLPGQHASASSQAEASEFGFVQQTTGSL